MKTKRALTITMLLASVQFFGTIQPMTVTKTVIIERNPANRAYIKLRGTRFQISQNTLEMNELYKTEKHFQELAVDQARQKAIETGKPIKAMKKKITETDGIITWDITEAM